MPFHSSPASRSKARIKPCWLVGLTLLGLLSPLPCFAQDAPEPPIEEPGEKTVRYLDALRKRPSSDTLFDRFFSAWLDEGSISGLGAYLERQSEAAEATTADRLLLGFFLARQGDHEQAIAAFNSALEDDPNQPEALLEIARLEFRALRLESALENLGRLGALELTPELTIEAGKLKGRILARTGDGEGALAAWKETADVFPDDVELREDLVDLQLDEGMTREAIAQMERLIESSDDAYDRVTRMLRLGDIHTREGQREPAIEIYDASLAAAGRETWLEKEILAKYEQVFRSEGDVAGLKNHLAELAEAEPDRIAIKKRLALVQAELNETDAAKATFSEVLRLTPGDRGNREVFVDLLGRLGQHEEAAEQMKALSELYPSDVELIAQLAIRQDAADQDDAAKNSVLTYLEKSDGSEYAHLRAARMLEEFAQDEAAGEIYAKMVSAFPESVEAKDSQAVYLHRTGKKEEAIALWKTIAETGSGEDAARAARALSGRGEREAAFAILQARVEDFTTDFAFLGQYLLEAAATEHWEEALPWAEIQLSLAGSSNELNEAIRQTVSILEKSGKADEWRDQHLEKPDRSVAQSCLLAEMLENDGQYEAAEEALAEPIKAGDLLAMTQRIRLYRLRDLWEEAAVMQRKLIDLPDGRRSANVQDLVAFYRRALKIEEALKWIEEWKKLSPGATQPWLEQASILRGDGKTEEAIEALRSACRKFEDRDELRAELASLYETEGRVDDAMQIYWSLYDHAEGIDQKLTWVGSLATVARSDGSIEELVEKFEERRRKNRTSVIPLLAIAEIHRRDYNQGARREILSEAAKMRPEDVALLHQIARVEEEQGNWEAAMETLRTAAAIDPTQRTRQQMAQLEMRYGDDEEGFRMILELSGGEDQLDADTALGLADSMIARSGWDRAKQFLEPFRDRFPDDYRIAYLRAVAMVEDGEVDEAREAFLDLAVWEHEIVKPAAIQGAQNNYLENFRGNQLPPRLETMLGYLGYSEAFRYRQMLQQGQFNFRVSYGAGNAGGSLVNLPPKLETAHQYAVVHLRSLAQSLPEEELSKLGAAMEDRGLAEASLILRFPFAEQYRSDLPFPVELLDEYPDDLALYGMAVFQQMGPIQNTNVSIDDELMARCFEKLKDDYPDLAFAAGVYAGASGTETGATLLKRAIEECPATEETS
ncbi:MAG: tetratricopeptide repeat protein, partial [Verrucomicrobiae bacterium]|nr:tetratricopeptide repeat protein [Verrucomicrobiae bacterium]